MLVLTRRENEGIILADQITVKVLKIRGNRVRLAIEAPNAVRVLRTELVDAAANGPSSFEPRPKPPVPITLVRAGGRYSRSETDTHALHTANCVLPVESLAQ